MNSLQRWFTAFRRSAHRSVHQISLREDTFNAPSASFQIPILHFHIRFQKDAIEALHCKCNAVERSVIKMNRDCVGQWCQRVLHHHTNSILPEWTAPPSLFSPLCGRFLHFFLSRRCFCSSSLHLGQVYSLCWCGRPGKWKVETTCQAKTSTSSSLFF